MNTCTNLGPRFVGDPVDVTTGEVRDVATDFRIDGRRGLVWNRHYHSLRAASDDIGLGRGHRHVFDWTLRTDVDGIRVETPDDPILFKHLWGDGASVTSKGWVLRRLARGRFTLSRFGEPTRHFEGGRLTEVAHSDGGQTSLRYHGRALVAVEDTEGWQLSLTWKGGLLRTIKASGPFAPFTAIAYEYDEAKRLLVHGRDAYGHAFTWSYDDAGRVTKRTDRRGYSFVFAYDGKGRCIRAAGEDDVDAVALEYASSGRETRVVHEANGATWWYRYRPDGALFEIEDPYGACRTFEYADDGTKIREFDGGGHEWVYERNSQGATTALRDPLGSLHPPDEEPADARALQHRVPPTALQQEHGGRLPLHFDVEPSTTLGATLPTSVAATLIPAEFAGTTRDVTDAQGLLLRTDRSFPGSTYTHSRRLAYDPNGNVRKVVDLDGAQWTYTYASWNQHTAIVDPLGGETQLAWNARDRLAAVRDPGGTRSEYTWDLCDRLAEVHRHGKLRERYLYDGAGGLIEKRGPGDHARVAYKRGPMNTLLSRKTWDGVKETFDRDAQGRIVEATNATRSTKRTVRRAYDRRGRKTLEESDEASFEHAYLGTHRTRTTFRTPTSKAFVVEFRDGANGSREIVDPTGRVHTTRQLGPGTVERTFANGAREFTQHDGTGRCLAKVSEGNSGAWRRRFVRSAEGDLSYREDDRRGSTEYTYDAAHRLTEVRDASGQTDTYEHDAAGNLLRKPGLREWSAASPGPADLRHNERVSLAGGNRLWRANGDRFHYDDQDHVESRSNDDAERQRQYEHDALGRLRAVLRKGRVLWAAEYDALGRRTHKFTYHDDGQIDAWAFFWDGDRLGAEVLPDGRLRLYVYADDDTLVPMLALEYASVEADPTSARVFALQSDHRGAIERVEDEAGEIVWEATVHPYGEVDINVGADFHQPFRLVGQYADPEIGLSYNRFRYWSPELGRFLQSDPLGLAGGMNLYAWPGCPLVTSDPLGLGCPGSKRRRKPPDESGPDQESVELDVQGGEGETPRLSGKNPPLSPRLELHVNGTAGKSQFKPDVDAASVTRTAWEQGVPEFNKQGKFLGKRFTFETPVGTSPSGRAQHSVFVHWSPTKGIHGVPTTRGVP